MSRDKDARSRLWAIRPWHIAVVLLCVLIVAFGVLRVTRRVRLHNRIEAVRAKGYPVTLEELNAWYPAPPSGENAADYIMQAIARLRIPPSKEKEQVPLLDAFRLLPRRQSLDDQTKSALVKLVDDNTDALHLLEQAARIEHCRYAIDLTSRDNMRVPSISGFNNIVGLLCFKAALHMEQTEVGPAVDATICAYRTAGSLAKEPVVISRALGRVCQLRATGILERILSRTSVDAGQLEHLEQTLATAYDPNGLEHTFISEQCFMLDNFRRSMSLSSIPPSENLSFVRFQMARISGAVDLAEIRYIDWIDRYLTVIRLPHRERVQAVTDIQRERNRLGDQQVLLHTIMPAFYGFIMSDVENLAQLLTARTALAIERYRLASGQLPGQLTDLVPTYLEHVPEDPFDGQPLRYRRLEKGYVVYSIGRDVRDNGGTELVSGQKGLRQPDADVTFIVER